MPKQTFERVLTLRELNRATLARQMLLERQALPAVTAIERLAGLQAQLPQAPYVGLWTRVLDFRRDALAESILDYRVVKATLMRATLHLFSADDYLRLRTSLQPALTQAYASIAKRRSGAEFDLEQILAAARDYIGQAPRTFEEISAMLTALRPASDVGAMRYGVRTHLPLVITPISSGWSYPGNPRFTLAESVLGKPIAGQLDTKLLVHRYLAAFGPASMADIQTWSGLPRLRDAIEALKPGLRIYGDEKGRELLDLPEMPLPAADAPAPVRFLPEFDNLLLGHSKRERIIPAEYHAHVFLSGLRVRSTILVDGFVAGAWKIEKTKTSARLAIEPFAPLSSKARKSLTDEAEQLVRFVEPDAKGYEVGFAE